MKVWTAVVDGALVRNGRITVQTLDGDWQGMMNRLLADDPIWLRKPHIALRELNQEGASTFGRGGMLIRYSEH